MKEKERAIFTTIGRMLIYMARSNKQKVPIIELRRYTSSQAYTAALMAEKLGLMKYDYDAKTVELTPEGRKLAECLANCMKEIES